VGATLEKYPMFNSVIREHDESVLQEPEFPAYGNPILSKVRIGQGAFRVGVIDAYNRRCSISGEKTLPVLEAAHIKPYAISGQNSIANGILLRSDMHKLFDTGYITVTPDHKVEISKRIKEEFENGREYYQHHGKSLLYLPGNISERPSATYLDWHNTTVYKG
jgi:putative restriction endonuclease